MNGHVYARVNCAAILQHQAGEVGFNVGLHSTENIDLKTHASKHNDCGQPSFGTICKSISEFRGPLGQKVFGKTQSKVPSWQYCSLFQASWQILDV
jgi:hypothetical protein